MTFCMQMFFKMDMGASSLVQRPFQVREVVGVITALSGGQQWTDYTGLTSHCPVVLDDIRNEEVNVGRTCFTFHL